MFKMSEEQLFQYSLSLTIMTLTTIRMTMIMSIVKDVNSGDVGEKDNVSTGSFINGNEKMSRNVILDYQS